MRFWPESDYEDNNGLEVARDALMAIKDMNPISYSDLWVLAGYTAVTEMGGPYIPFEGGRTDAVCEQQQCAACPPEERLPGWNETAADVRKKFKRMGLDDRDLVALMGAHTVGHTYPENSGFPYMQWDNSPRKFDNMYYVFLINQGWQPDSEKGQDFYYNRSWIMLLTDYMIRTDPAFRSIALEYIDDESKWFDDFSSAFKKVTEVGLKDGCPKLFESNSIGCPYTRMQR
jgi:catalase (peroxidase I)